MKVLARGVAALITLTALACSSSPMQPSRTPRTKPTFQTVAPVQAGLAGASLTAR